MILDNFFDEEEQKRMSRKFEGNYILRRERKIDYFIAIGLGQDFSDACEDLLLTHDCPEAKPQENSDDEYEYEEEEEEEQQEEQQKSKEPVFGPENYKPGSVKNVFELRNYFDEKNWSIYKENVHKCAVKYLNERDKIEHSFMSAVDMEEEERYFNESKSPESSE